MSFCPFAGSLILGSKMTPSFHLSQSNNPIFIPFRMNFSLLFLTIPYDKNPAYPHFSGTTSV